jgi:hypothetical protein
LATRERSPGQREGWLDARGDRATGGTTLPPEKTNEKYQSVTFRVIAPVMEVARVGAVEEGISLNSLANRQLRQYAEWDRVERKLGYVTVRDRVIRSILDRISEDEVVAMGRNLGEVEVREYITLNWRTMNLENFLHFVDNYARYSGQFRVEHHREREHTLVLFHRLGAKWSLYLEAFMSSALDASLGQKAKTEWTDESVALTFSTNRNGIGSRRGNSRPTNSGEIRSNNSRKNSVRRNNSK